MSHSGTVKVTNIDCRIKIFILFFSALLSILGDCSAILRPGESATAKNTKYTELIMKCLWKLAKTIQENLRSDVLNPDELLYDINRFFITTRPLEWKRRATENVPLGEMPLRTVKTLLLELVNGLGDNIFQHLTLIDDPQRSSVYPYLHHMLEACRKKDKQQQQLRQPPILSSQPMQQVEDGNRFVSHSRNSSLGRPPSASSVKPNNTMMRTPSMASYPSTDGEQQHNNAMESMSTNQSPRLASPSINNNQLQPMQIDEPQQDNNGSPPILSDFQLNNILTKIFQKIGTRDQTKLVRGKRVKKNFGICLTVYINSLFF